MPVGVSLSRWSTSSATSVVGSGQLRLRAAGRYVRSDDTTLLAELARTWAFAGLHFVLIAPTVLISSADEATVLGALRAEGYVPAVEGVDGAIQVQAPDRPRASAAKSAPQGTGPDLAELIARLRQPPIVPAATPLRLVPLRVDSWGGQLQPAGCSGQAGDAR